MDFLIEGFALGFPLGATTIPPPGPPPNGHSLQANLPAARAIILKELELGRMLGPYPTSPLLRVTYSPLNLVDKSGKPGKFHLIHNLAYPYDGTSINDCIPDAHAMVEYESFDSFLTKVLFHCQGCYLGKMDLKSTFHQLPICVQDLPLLGFTLDDEYYINSTLAFGARSSCQIFEKFATALNWKLNQNEPPNVSSHYLDDFAFMHLFIAMVEWLMSKLDAICSTIGFPLAPDKCEGLVQRLIFLGLLIDTITMRITIPEEKIHAALHAIMAMLGRADHRKKLLVWDVQKLTGLLQFIARATPTGHPFLRALYDCQVGQRKSHYTHVSVAASHDLHMWRIFLQTLDRPDLQSLPILPFLKVPNYELELFADATGNPKLGFGCVFGTQWAHGAWPLSLFANKAKPSIAELELFALCIALDLWAPELAGKHIHLCSDNDAVVHLLDPACRMSWVAPLMFLLHHLTITCLRFQICLTAEHVPGVRNVMADLLSCHQINCFVAEFPRMRPMLCPLPVPLWPPCYRDWCQPYHQWHASNAAIAMLARSPGATTPQP